MNKDELIKVLQDQNKKLQQERDNAIKKYENMRYKILHMFEGEVEK